MVSLEPNLSDLVLRIEAAIAEGREAELLAELDIPLGQEGQFDAARDDLIRGLLTTPGVDQRDLGFAEQPGWLRLGIIMGSARWLAGQVRTCPTTPQRSNRNPCTWHCGFPIWWCAENAPTYSWRPSTRSALVAG